MNQIPHPTKLPTKNSNNSGMPIDRVQFLVVDDYAVVRRIVVEGLKSCGAKNIHGAQDCGEATSFLKLRLPCIRDKVLIEMMSSHPDIASDLSSESADFRSEHTNCVITDFSMENGTGLDLLKAIRCGETNIPRDTPVILLTGYSDDFVIAAAVELDVSAFIVKPVSRNTLQDRLNRVMKAKLRLKPVSTYAAVMIPDEKGRCRAEKGASNMPPRDGIDLDDGKQTRWLSVMAVQAGAVLAEDLRTDRGALLMQAGTVLSSRVIQRLRDVADAKGLHGKIPIRPME